MKLPRVSGKEVIKALSKAGFISVRQRGSYVVMRKEVTETAIVLVVPLHSEIDRGTLLEIIRQSKLTKEDFLDLI